MNKFLFLTFLTIGCASIKPPSGGEKDIIPPKVVQTFPDSAALNVSTDRIEITFDEYVKTKDIGNLLIISPSPEVKPITNIKNKTLVIKFDKPLETKTTYSVMINGSIIDNNEGNPLDNYTLYFSTGPYLDSLQYQATIIESYSKRRCDGCLLALYNSTNDSVPLITNPVYLARTTGSGSAFIPNLPPNSYQAYAFKDENKNLKLDDEEMISISKIIQPLDSAGSDTFYIFPYYKDKKHKPQAVKRNYPGVEKYSFERPLSKIAPLLEISTESDSTGFVTLPYSLNRTKDTLTTHFPALKDTPQFIRMKIDTNEFSFNYPEQKLDSIYKITSANYKAGIIKIHSPQWIQKIDPTKFTLIKDSVTITSDSILFYESTVSIFYTSEEKLKLYLLKGAITDINSELNTKDSFSLSVIANPGSILNLVVEPKINNTYILQLLKDDKIVKQDTFSGRYKNTYRDLLAGNYRLRIITDLNKNMLWDTGDFLNKIKPEPIYLSEPIELRPNWDKELLINDL